jgi:hypothetical protein
MGILVQEWEKQLEGKYTKGKKRGTWVKWDERGAKITEGEVSIWKDAWQVDRLVCERTKGTGKSLDSWQKGWELDVVGHAGRCGKS